MTGTCYLINPGAYSQNAFKQVIPGNPTKREVLCEEMSVTGKEWHEAKQNGMTAGIVLKTAYVNYDGEETVEYGGKTYQVYRTYKRDDDIELYLEERVGR